MNGAARTQGLWTLLERPRAVYSILILYCLLHFVLRLALSPNYGVGEAGPMLFNQGFPWARHFGEPPLYDWLAWAVAAVSANSRAAFFLLKYAIMAAGFAGYFSAARILIGDAKLAALSVFGLLSTFAAGYVFHAGFTHSILLAAMSGLFLWALARAIAAGGLADYLLLGIAAGLGALSAYVFALMPAAFAVAIALTPALRRRVRPLPLAGALLAAIAIAVPYAWWSQANWLAALGGAAAESGASALGSGNLLRNSVRFAEAAFEFLVPLIPAFPIVYRRASKPLASGIGNERDFAWLRACGVAMLVAVAAMWAGAVVLGGAGFDKGWVFPVLMPLPIWLFLRAKLSGADDRANTIFLAFAGLFALGVFVARPVVYLTGAAHCHSCREYWPMAAYAQSLERAGFYRGTIVASGADLGGNIRYVMPDSRVVVPGYRPSVFGQARGGQCLVVWRGKAEMPKDEAAYLRDILHARAGSDAMRGNVLASLITSRSRFDTLNYVLLPSGSGLCN